MIRFKDISLRLKFIYLVVIIMVLAIGFGIIIYNSDYKERDLNNKLALVHSLKTDIYHFQAKLAQLNILVYDIAMETSKDKIYLYQRRIQDMKMQFDTLTSVKYQKYEKIMQEKEFNVSEFNLLDTILFYKKRIDDIFTALKVMYRYQNLALNEAKVRSNYKQLLEEQASLRDLYLTMDTVKVQVIVDNLIRVYRNQVERYRDFISHSISKSIISINILDQLLTLMEYRFYRELNTVSRRKLITAFVFIILFVVIVLIISYVLIDRMWQPLQHIVEITNTLALGKLPDYKAEDRYDEIGLLSEAIEKLVKGLKETVFFAQSLGQGNFDYEFSPLSNEDVFGAALIEMRESLIQAKKEEERRKKEDYIRNRSAEATALFADILRKNQNQLSKLGDEVIINLVRFFNANQGMFFILNDRDEKHKFLELLSAYAWNRKKYLEKIIELGEGLIGAVAVEKFTVYMTDVPEDYIEIKSGTGEANPTSILIVPLLTNEEVMGVIEIASFYEFESYEIELIENIAESIAATIRTAKINEQTAELLERFQIQTAEMREQELLMKQTIETLKKTEENYKEKEKQLQESLKDLEALNKQLMYKDEQLKKEVEKIRKEYKQKIIELQQYQQLTKDILNAMLDAIFIIDNEDNIIFVNKAAINNYGYTVDDFKDNKLTKFIDIILPENKTLYQFFIENKKNFDSQGKELKIRTKYGEIIDVLVNVIETSSGLIVFAKDLSLFKKQNKEVEKIIEFYMKNEIYLLRKIEILESILIEHKIPIPDYEKLTNELVSFTDKYYLGIELIDKQHKKWFEFINKLYKALEKGEARDKLNEIFKDLIDYTNYHFGFEEQYMKDFNLAIYESHHLKHQEFITTLLDLYNEYISGKVDTPYKLLITLKKWVESHVLYDDRKYVDDFKKHGLK